MLKEFLLERSVGKFLQWEGKWFGRVTLCTDNVSRCDAEPRHSVLLLWSPSFILQLGRLTAWWWRCNLAQFLATPRWGSRLTLEGRIVGAAVKIILDFGSRLRYSVSVQFFIGTEASVFHSKEASVFHRKKRSLRGCQSPDKFCSQIWKDYATLCWMRDGEDQTWATIKVRLYFFVFTWTNTP